MRGRKPQTQQTQNTPLAIVDSPKTALDGIGVLSSALHNSKVVYTHRKVGRRVDKITPINMSCFIARLYSLIRAREAILDLACSADYEADVSTLDRVLFSIIQSLIASGNNAIVDTETTSETDSGEAVLTFELRDQDVPADQFISLFYLDAFEVRLDDHEHAYAVEDFCGLIEQNGDKVMGKLGRAVVANRYRGLDPDFTLFVDKMVAGVETVRLSGRARDDDGELVMEFEE